MRTGPGRGREDRGAARSGSHDRAPSSAILDTAFRRAYRASVRGKDAFDRSRRRAMLKIVRSSAVVLRHLRLVEKPFSGRTFSAFDGILLDRKFGKGSVNRSRERLQRAMERIRGLQRSEEIVVRRASSEEAFGTSVRRFYGRLASHLREIDPDIELLRAAAVFLKRRPQIEPDQPTIAIAGFPNVGKSSLVAQLTSARPKVAAYPFTTVQVGVGHADIGVDHWQVLDTPGVLGRKGQRNPSEEEAEAVVAESADIVVFVLDPSGASGYTVEEQEHLLDVWRKKLGAVPLVVVETKVDLVRRPTGAYHVSSHTGEGLDELRRAIQGLIRQYVPTPETRMEEYDAGTV
ncbi:MAG: GTPase [Thermoplasmata archaeon]